MNSVNMRSIFRQFLSVILLTHVSPARCSFFSRCPGTERCFFGFFVVMRIGSADSDQCTEYCVFFQNPTLQCGRCDVRPGGAPAPSPTVPTPIAPTNSQYDIALSLVGIPSDDRSLFTDAVARWESIVVGDLQSISRSSLQYSLSSGCTVPATIDDLYICARYDSIGGSV
jgi:hypothetical protein